MGLTDAEVKSKREEFGWNELPEKEVRDKGGRHGRRYPDQTLLTRLMCKPHTPRP